MIFPHFEQQLSIREIDTSEVGKYILSPEVSLTVKYNAQIIELIVESKGVSEEVQKLIFETTKQLQKEFLFTPVKQYLPFRI
jgi:hypothetical protein